MDVNVAVQALEVSLRGFCYPTIYLNADRFSTGASEELVALVSQMLERCHPSIQAYLSAKGFYTPLTKFCGPEWHKCFESFMRDNVHLLENPLSIPILPASSWDKASFAVAKLKEVLGFVRILKAAVPKKKRALQEHRPTSSLSQALKTSKVGLEGVELTTPDDCNSKQMLRVAFAGADSSGSFDEAVESESCTYQSSTQRPRERTYGSVSDDTCMQRRAPRSAYARQLSPRSQTDLGECTMRDIANSLEKAINAIQLVNAKVDGVSGRLDALERKIDRILAVL